MSKGNNRIPESKPQEDPSVTTDRHPVTIIILTWNGLHYTNNHNDASREHNICGLQAGRGGQREHRRDNRISENAAFRHNNFKREQSGFREGNNHAIANCDSSSDILLLNNDTEIHQSDWIERLQETAYSAPNIGVVGCRLVRPDGMLQHAGTYMPIETFWGQQLGSGEKDINQYNGDRDVEGVVFACAYIKRQALVDIGLLDEDYFSYFEDTDYCFRAMEKGYRVVCCGSVTIVHHENVSTKVNAVPHKSHVPARTEGLSRQMGETTAR